IDELDRAIAIGETQLKAFRATVQCCKVVLQFAIEIGNRFEGINACARALLCDENAENSDIGPDVENTGSLWKTNSMLEIRTLFENFPIQIIGLVPVLMINDDAV